VKLIVTEQVFIFSLTLQTAFRTRAINILRAIKEATMKNKLRRLHRRSCSALDKFL
jgi:hypothetical protein